MRRIHLGGALRRFAGAPRGPELQTRVGVHRGADAMRAPSRYLSVAAIFRNEAPRLAEWVEFHREVGAEHIYLYDHASEDDPASVLAPFVAEGFVTLVPWNLPWLLGGSDAQTFAYAHAIGSFGSDWRWMAFLDTDEFLYPVSGESLPEFLRDFEEFPAVVAFWTNFGFSGHDEPPPGLIIENYVMRAPFGLHAKPKSIVDPREVVAVSNPHLFDLRSGPRRGFTEARQLFAKVEEAGGGKRTAGTPVSERLRLNHYYTRSRREFEAKLAKRVASGRAADCPKLEGIAQGIEASAFLDDGILLYVPRVRARLGIRSPIGTAAPAVR